MSIKIEITNPHEMPWETIHKTAIYLLGLIGEQMPNNPVITAAKDMQGSLEKSENFAGASVPPIVQVPPVPPTMTVIDEQIPKEAILNAGFQALGQMIEKETQSVNQETVKIMEDIIKDHNLDSEGTPHDERIHLKTKDKDGRWKKRKNMSNVFSQPKEEIKEEPIVPVIPPVPEAHMPQEETFHSLMLKITAAINEGKVTHSAVINMVNDEGIQFVPLLATRLDLIPKIAEKFKKLIEGK